MPIKWKQGPRFKPAVVLKKIDSVRTISADGGASFSGFELEDCLPALQSMLAFPAAAAEVDTSALVWRGLATVDKELNPNSFIAAINTELSKTLATKEQSYSLLTSISVDHRDIPAQFRMNDIEIRFLPGDYSRLFRSRGDLLSAHSLPVPPTPRTYCKVVAKIKAKSPTSAVNKAMRALDLQRALWCLMGNPQMQVTFGRSSFAPINVVRLGSQHTLHLADGTAANECVWFEPGFVEASIFRFKSPDVIKHNSRWALRQITACPYGEQLVASLVRYVHALDERDANSAFLGLWGALEALTTPNQANYDNTVRRCSFLFKDRTFHTQMLEHLREYRNVYVHAGESSNRARTHCYQLQLYFASLIWFHIRNARFFLSIDEANQFLDSPSNTTELKRRVRLAQKAVVFVS